MLFCIVFSINAKAQSGILDLTFDPGTGADNYVIATAIQNDGKIIIGGGFTSYNGTARNFIARLNTDGSLDATFNPGTGANSEIYTTAIQSDGKIIIGGMFTNYNGTARNYIARLNTDGSLDATFNPGTGANDGVVTITIQSDGKIIIGGYYTAYNGTARNRIARLNADGSIDATFNPGTGVSGPLFTTAIQSDGKIIIGGNFTSYNGTARNYIARLNTDGSLDATFNVGAGADFYLNSIAIQSDGKIIIGGMFTTYNGTARSRVARINADGSLDATFNPGTGANFYVNSTVIQSDGKIVIGGNFTTYNSQAINRIARINADGSLDATFNPGMGTNQPVYATPIQSDGKIIIVGDFTIYNGTARNRIARIYACTDLLPAQPSLITGSATPCQTTSQNYSVTNVAGVTYNWTFPTGWTQTGGGTTNAITVTVGAGLGNITVTPSNSCGYGTARILAVTPTTTPGQPSTITGNVTPYYGTSENYSVTNVADVTYTWVFPIAWVQTSGGNTNSVTVTIGSGSGYVICIPSNSCGDGTPRALAVAVYGVGIKENNNENGLIIYPNPAEGIVSMNFKGYSGEIKITINNAMGGLVHTENMVVGSDNYIKTIDMANYPNGVYYIQILNNGKLGVEKIVKL